jgi:hypothetical protein
VISAEQLYAARQGLRGECSDTAGHTAAASLDAVFSLGDFTTLFPASPTA